MVDERLDIIAVAYGIEKELLAANIGAATPLLVEALTSGVGETSPPDAVEKAEDAETT